MEISPSPAAPATDPQPATLFVALELSKAKWLVGLHSPMADKVSRHTIAGVRKEALLTLIGAARRRAEAGLGGTVRRMGGPAEAGTGRHLLRGRLGWSLAAPAPGGARPREYDHRPSAVA